MGLKTWYPKHGWGVDILLRKGLENSKSRKVTLTTSPPCHFLNIIKPFSERHLLCQETLLNTQASLRFSSATITSYSLPYHVPLPQSTQTLGSSFPYEGSHVT